MFRLSGMAVLGLLAGTLGCRPSHEPPSAVTPQSARGTAQPSKVDSADLADVPPVAMANNTLAFELLRQMPAEGNLFFSPMSISMAAGIVYGGAKGETAAEMAKALQYPFEGERLHLAHGRLLSSLANRQRAGIDLHMANALWGPFDYREEFLRITRECYASHVRKINLSGAEPVINRWAEESTSGRIKDLLAPNSLDGASTLVLTSAVYFKAPWKFRFAKAQTREAPFRLADGNRVMTPMMKLKGRLRMGSTRDDGDPDASVLEMPYVGNELSMAIILPHAVDGVKELERMLTPKKLGQWLASARTLDVQVQLPRFTIARGTIRLNEPLKALGLFRLFDKKADMSGICAAPGELWIRQALEQALVEVNEEGAEAASVAVFEGKKGGGPDIEDFTADHPFLFVIRDGQTGCILFVGRLNDPS